MMRFECAYFNHIIAAAGHQWCDWGLSSWFLNFRSSCLWRRGKGLMQESRMNLSINLQLLQTLRHPTVMTRYNSRLWLITSSKSQLDDHTWAELSRSPPLSSGLLVVPKAKRRSSRGKVMRRRMQQRKKWIRQQRLAARMETAQQRAQHQRRVSIQLLSFCLGAGGLQESAKFHWEDALMEENIHRDAIWMSVLCNWD